VNPRRRTRLSRETTDNMSRVEYCVIIHALPKYSSIYVYLAGKILASLETSVIACTWNWLDTENGGWLSMYICPNRVIDV
jgi:hypothetical protein